MENDRNIESFIKVLDNKLNEYLDRKEEDLRDPIERIIEYLEISITEWNR